MAHIIYPPSLCLDIPQYTQTSAGFFCPNFLKFGLALPCTAFTIVWWPFTIPPLISTLLLPAFCNEKLLYLFILSNCKTSEKGSFISGKGFIINTWDLTCAYESFKPFSAFQLVLQLGTQSQAGTGLRMHILSQIIFKLVKYCAASTDACFKV